MNTVRRLDLSPSHNAVSMLCLKTLHPPQGHCGGCSEKADQAFLFASGKNACLFQGTEEAGEPAAEQQQ